MPDEARQQYVDYVSGQLPGLRRLGYLLCGDEHRADSLVQQTITKLYVHWRRISAVDRLDQYVRTMLLHAFLDEKRRPWARVGLFAAAPEPEPPLQHDVEQRLVLRAALGRLARRQQAVLVLRFLCDLPVEEVAHLLGCSPGTVKSQTSRGLAALSRQLGEDQLASLSRGM
jgi:RNA polymerase sigma-70 factor (sigma-E family)